MVTRPTLTWIGERGPEVVVPLDKANRHGFTGWGGGGGGGISIAIGKIGSDVADLSPSEQGRLVGDSYARQLRASGGLRNLANARARSLYR